MKYKRRINIVFQHWGFRLGSVDKTYVCLSIMPTRSAMPDHCFLFFYICNIKKSKMLRRKPSLTPCHFQVSPGMYYFQETLEYTLLKSHGQLITWLTVTSKKLWKGRERFQWNLPKMTFISWAHKDNNALPGKTGSWNFCKWVIMLS